MRRGEAEILSFSYKNFPPMEIALEEARKAFKCEEVPVGAVLLDKNNHILARAYNHVETEYDASAHAEIRVMRQAAQKLGSSRLLDCTLVVTLEPCAMCAAAISHFRIKKLIYGAYDPKGGAVDHGVRFFEQRSCLHRPAEVISGMREREAAILLKTFFQMRR